MKCVILCAGYAVRLYPLTSDKPKALLPIKGIPLLTNIIKRLKDIEDIDQIFIVSNDKFYSNFVWWLQNLNLKIKEKIEIINDRTSSNENRLEGIGDLNYVMNSENINDDILVILGDNLFYFDFKDFINFYKRFKDTLMGVVPFEKEKLKKLGVVNIKDNIVIGFEEKPEHPKSNLASVGIYIFNKNDLNLIKEYAKTDLNQAGPGYLIQYFISIKKRVYGYKFCGEWYDIGDINTYNEVKGG